MANDTDIETITRKESAASNGRGSVAVSPTQVTDSRLVSDDVGRSVAGHTSVRTDIGSAGMQFILASWASMYTGLFLVIAPFAFTYASYAPKAHANEMVIGALVASMGATRVFGNYRSGRLNEIISGLTIIPGIWLIISPFVLQYSDRIRPTRVDIITGIAIVLLGLWSWMTSRDDETVNSTAGNLNH